MRAGRWMPRNDTSWSPDRIVVLDAEGSTRKLHDVGEVDTFRGAVASFDVRGKHRTNARTEWGSWWAPEHGPADVWRWIATRTTDRGVTYVVTHGLHYDYTVTAAERELVALGWERVDWSVRAGARWIRWRRGKRSMVIVDLFNYLGTTIRAIGQTLRWPKGDLPHARATRRSWERYCRRDVEIARTALLRLLDWWDAHDLGRWGFTSAALSLSAFRHRFMRERQLWVHADGAARALERRALFGGRREIYRKGRLSEDVWADLDYRSHYLATAAECNVPVELGHVHPGAEIRADLLESLPSDMGVIARVIVDVDAPVVPSRHPKLGVIYRTGRFETTLCQPELELVAAHGRIVEWLEVATYALAPALESWSEWLFGAIDGGETDPLVQLLLKDWTRSLIGKFGQRKPTPRPEPGPDGVVELPPIEVSPDQVIPELPWIEGPAPDPERGEDSRNAVPAITAWIHSAARATLWRAMEVVGREAVAYCDTDGMLVRVGPDNVHALEFLSPDVDASAPSPRGAVPTFEELHPLPTAKSRRRVSRPKVPERKAARIPPGRMAVKDVFGTVELHRPQDYVLDGAEVIKGLPRQREVIGDRRYRATYWPGIPWQIQHGKPGTYVRPVLEVTLGSDYDRGWVATDGRVLPLVSEVRAGRTRILPWNRTPYARAGVELLDPEQAARIAQAERSPPT